MKPSFLTNQNMRLLLFGGKGGVGKTTCATATALHLAQTHPQATFLLVSTDPAHSLADSLATTPANLKLLELDAQACLATFKEKHNDKLREIASRGTFLDDEDIRQLMDLSLPGLDELMAFLEIADWVTEQRYNTIIVDTAPTGHTLRLLDMPTLLRKWLKALDTLLAKHRYMKRVLGGSMDYDALDQFLENLAVSINQMETLLQNPEQCRFVPVMIAEILSLNETQRLLAQLQRLKIPVYDLVVNKRFPANHSSRSARQQNVLTQIVTLPYTVWQIPVYPTEVCGLDVLKQFWENVTRLNEITPTSLEESGKPLVENPAILLATKKLYLFAGKGGVGKTTLACATALRLALEQPDKETLLFSTDPAHSLSDCLGVQVSPKPTTICQGLLAMEMNPETEFNALKQQYTSEVQAFFQSLSRLDLPFDREVMERLMDLSPPGLDEVMALSQIIEFITQGQYDTLILDTAPTGHLIRFLEMPALIDQWLKVLFSIFLKYKHIFRLPHVFQKLVNISKQIKQLRTLLHDSNQSVLYVVTLLEEMAFCETQDLVAACERMNINVPVLFFNLVTPINDDKLSIALHRRELLIKKKFELQFPDKHQTLIYQSGELRGVEQLIKLGQVLYNV